MRAIQVLPDFEYNWAEAIETAMVGQRIALYHLSQQRGAGTDEPISQTVGCFHLGSRVSTSEYQNVECIIHPARNT
jgi:hypothetical protein